MRQKRKATKAIRIKEDDKVTRIVPAARDLKVEAKPKPGGGISLTMEMFLDSDEEDS